MRIFFGVVWVVIILPYFFMTLCFAQNRFGTTPQINAEFDISQFVSIDAKIQNRFLLYQNPLEESSNRSGFDHTGIQFVATAKKGFLKNFGAGYLFRWDNSDGRFVHRIIEQYTTEQQLDVVQLEHRIRADQTFQREEGAKYRFRYSIGVEQPLNGITIDPKEYYLALDNEYVGSFQDGTGHVEIRFSSALGYNISKDDQLEAGLDYRASNLMERDAINTLWLNIGWRHSF